MEAFLAMIGGKLGLVALAGGTALSGYLAKKFVPGLIQKYLGIGLRFVLDPKTSDPKEKQLIHDLALAAVKLVEYKIPDSGQGGVKKEVVSALLQKVMPKAQADILSEIVEQAVATMDAELKKVQ